MKSSGTAYLLWCAGLFGGCGLHRFYLGKYGTGILYFFTFGLLGIGQLIDVFRIPGMVEHENLKRQLRHGPTVNINIQGQTEQPFTVEAGYQTVQDSRSLQQAQPEVDSEKALETTILKLARQFKGRLTPLELAAHSSLSLEEADQALEDIVRRGYADMTVTDAGNIVYEFPGFLEFDDSSPKGLHE